MAFKIARRALSAPPAVIDELLCRYLGPQAASVSEWVNLAPGAAHFGPPQEVQDLLKNEAADNVAALSKYGDVAGEPDLLDELRAKLTRRNSLDLGGKDVMVTAGANQAFVNIALALLDPGEEVILFRPFYFSHWTAVQIAGGVPVATKDTTETGPTVEALKEVVTEKTRVVFLVTPGNPTGACISEAALTAIHLFCRANGIWLVLDEAYEHFVYDGATHLSLDASDGVINVFTMSKTYGLAGWRIGYMVYPSYLGSTMAKVQDTVPTHSSILSQRCAAAALRSDPAWIDMRVREMRETRDVFVSALGDFMDVKVPNGAFYLFLQLPMGCDDSHAVEFMAEKHKVLVVPGHAFGSPGYVRVCFGSIAPSRATEAATRLAVAYSDLVKVSAGRRVGPGPG